MPWSCSALVLLRGHQRCGLDKMPTEDMCGVHKLRDRIIKIEQQRDEAWAEVQRLSESEAKRLKEIPRHTGAESSLDMVLTLTRPHAALTGAGGL